LKRKTVIYISQSMIIVFLSGRNGLDIRIVTFCCCMTCRPGVTAWVARRCRCCSRNVWGAQSPDHRETPTPWRSRTHAVMTY